RFALIEFPDAASCFLSALRVSKSPMTSKPLHPSKAKLSTFVSLHCSTTPVKPTQLAKAQ
ncbi:MAG: hypothetical protein LBS35_12380, partial [Synergistaceae bacterium]|nr:hypothetical protein [Synergistaceae bacterium]